ncbi:MAG: anthranilate synthase component I family protein [Planctomycetota bacterium]|nr:anthranilate synthase component I family protein [Planctomycetota bacterium]
MRYSIPRIRLDSSDPSSPWNYSPLPAPTSILYCDARTLHAVHSTFWRVEKVWENPLDALQWISEYPEPHLPNARWVGYLSYDLGRLFENIPGRIAQRDDDWPLFMFTFHADDEHDVPCMYGETREDAIYSNGPLTSNFTRPQYEATVARAIEYINAGDIFQVNLSQKFTAPLPDDPLAIYQRLRTRTPALYGAYLEYGSDALVCNSPELFLRVLPDPLTGKRRVLTRPIKGTRPRRGGMDLELLESVKDQAELNMIVDLERNDLGRVCTIGSVKVVEPRTIETHPTLYHGVAAVEGILRDDVGLVDLLRATFPGGSITGAPKIRAMQIIDELEPDRRGPYCGAIGYLCGDGRMEFNIAIRTIIVRSNRVQIPVGGGIVADSTGESEYAETLTKAKALFDALGIEIDRD